MRFPGEALFFLGTFGAGMWLGPNLLSWMWSNGSLALIIVGWLIFGSLMGLASLGSLLK